MQPLTGSLAYRLPVSVKPLDINIQPPEKTLSAGNTVELVCTSSGSRPPAVLSWWKGDEQVKATKEDFAKGKKFV